MNFKTKIGMKMIKSGAKLAGNGTMSWVTTVATPLNIFAFLFFLGLLINATKSVLKPKVEIKAEVDADPA